VGIIYTSLTWVLIRISFLTGHFFLRTKYLGLKKEQCEVPWRRVSKKGAESRWKGGKKGRGKITKWSPGQ
jgi:hypothetical protein